MRSDRGTAAAAARAMRNPSARTGLLCAASAFFIWGAVPIYFAWLKAVPAFEIIAHRVLWSMVFLVLLLRATRGFGEVRAVLREPRLLARLAGSSALITLNWLTFVWAVNAGRILDTSLGYYITPLVNVLLGLLFLRERLRRAQWVAVLLALLGVLNQVWRLGQLPWISLVLAASFGSYGLFRKQIRVDPVVGLLVETTIAAPFAFAYLVRLESTGGLRFLHAGRGIDALLMFLGVLTAVPLTLFAAGAQRLRLSTVGFLQYIAPSMTFLLAVFVFGEPLGAAQVTTFLFIWAGIAVYAADNWRAARQAARAPASR
jgi:chloramphenicol-sensitive protein RarD